jgi:hypothetical protein
VKHISPCGHIQRKREGERGGRERERLASSIGNLLFVCLYQKSPKADAQGKKNNAKYVVLMDKEDARKVELGMPENFAPLLIN